MKNTGLLIGFGSFLLLAIFSFCFYLFSANREDFKVQELNVMAKNELVSNFDYSSRITEGISFFDQESFETKVRSGIPKNFKKGSQVTFTYLREETGTVKSVRIVVNEGKNIYQTTLLANINEGKGKE
ncbi:hypothetical protein [Vagococcus fluvialis]|uniref:hypothetical protein n=1 Tax=Vagococcus fluvialis TaxID=2738 RepID=UPI003B223E0B